MLLFCSLAALFTQCNSKKNSKNAKVVMELTISSDYCGGAAPSEEMLKEMNSAKPYVSGKFYVVQKNDEGILLSETEHITNAEGKLTLKIKKGMYQIYLFSSEQRKKLVSNMDAKFRSCSTIFYEQAQGQLHAWQKGKQQINLHVKCNPCLPPAP